MDPLLKQTFLDRWPRYFGAAPLPLTFYYTDEEKGGERAIPGKVHRCLIGSFARILAGHALCFDAASVGCPGGRRYCGFSDTLMPGFNHFLSYGIPGKVEGERYKKDPETVARVMAQAPKLPAPTRFLVLKRWDLLEADEEPLAVVFVATPDVLAGLFTLAGYAEDRSQSVITPFGAGCGTAIQHPHLEQLSDAPRCVLGGFDPSARPFLPAHTLTFGVPMKKFVSMVADMDESFLITPTWERMRKRIGGG